MLRRLASLTILSLVAFGCGPSTAPVADAVEITGTVTQAGSPVKDLTLTLQPLDGGRLTGLTINAKGTFTGTAIAGKYAFFVTTSDPDSPTGKDKLKSIPETFRAADLSRTIEVPKGGGNLDVRLQ